MLVLHVRLGCGSLSIITPVSLLMNELNVQGGKGSLAGVNNVRVIHEVMNGCKNLKVH